LAGTDIAGGVDDGDVFAFVETKRFRRHLAVFRALYDPQLIGIFVAKVCLDLFFQIVAILGAVDQSHLFRFDGAIRSFIDDGPNVVSGRIASLGDRFNVAIEEIVEQRVHELAMRVRHVLTRERVADAFVFSNLKDVRIDAELVE